jgi:hypothetical protein
VRLLQRLAFAEGFGGLLVVAVPRLDGRSWHPRDGRRVA